MFTMLGSPGPPDLRQWQVTFTIIHMGSFLVQLIHQMGKGNCDADPNGWTGWTFTLTITLAVALILFAVTKDYMDKYVYTSKI